MSAPAELEPGVVVSHLRGEIEVRADAGAPRTLRCFVRTALPPLVTGDRVRFRREDDAADRGVIEALDPRRTLLARHTPRGLRGVCANLDVLLVTFAPQPAPHADLVDRYLLAAELCELEAVLVVNKLDTASDADRTQLEALIAPRARLGVQAVEVSAQSGLGLDALRAAIGARSAAFVGQSGVGKSSLLNALVPEADAETGDLSARSNRGRSRGRHTTSTTRLYETGNALIVDSPGIREFVPDVPDARTLTAGFVEIARAAQRCRFGDCRHDREPDCGVREALDAGEIDPSRLASFFLLRDELDARAT